MDNSSCYACGATNSKDIYAQVGKYTLSKCRQCKLIKTEGVKYEDVKKLYLEDDYYSDKGGSGFATDVYDENGNPIFVDHYTKKRLLPIERFVKRPSSESKIDYLDIGCSAGNTMAIARQRGWNVKGIEPSEVAVKFACEKLNLDVTQCDIDQMDLSTESFDVISLFHVLEHVEDPKKTLQKIREGLRKDGILALEVPNIESLPAKLKKKSWHGYVLPYHLWHFSLSPLVKIIEDSGYNVIWSCTPYEICSSSHIVNLHRPVANLVNMFRGKKEAPKEYQTESDSNSTSLVAPTRTLSQKIIYNSIVNLYRPMDQLMALSGMAEDLYIIAQKKE